MHLGSVYLYQLGLVRFLWRLISCNRRIGVPVLLRVAVDGQGLQTELAATSHSIPATDSPANRLSTQLGTMPDTSPGAVKPPRGHQGPPLPPEGMGPGWGRGQASEPPAPAWQDAPGLPRIVLLCTASHLLPAERRGHHTLASRRIRQAGRRRGAAAEAGSPEVKGEPLASSVLGGSAPLRCCQEPHKSSPCHTAM